VRTRHNRPSHPVSFERRLPHGVCAAAKHNQKKGKRGAGSFRRHSSTTSKLFFQSLIPARFPSLACSNSSLWREFSTVLGATLEGKSDYITPTLTTLKNGRFAFQNQSKNRQRSSSSVGAAAFLVAAAVAVVAVAVLTSLFSTLNTVLSQPVSFGGKRGEKRRRGRERDKRKRGRRNLSVLLCPLSVVSQQRLQQCRQPFQ
jgi:hypothetical protein